MCCDKHYPYQGWWRGVVIVHGWAKGSAQPLSECFRPQPVKSKALRHNYIVLNHDHCQRTPNGITNNELLYSLKKAMFQSDLFTTGTLHYIIVTLFKYW